MQTVKSFSSIVLLTWIAAGCASPYLRRALFVVEAADAEVPVMVSRTQSNTVGRPLHASSATRDDYSKSSAPMGTFNGVTVSLETTTIEKSWSDAAPWPQLKRHVLPNDRWLQITGIKYTAFDESGFGYSSTQRSVDVEAVAR
jgi:hypothetical protein